MKVAIPPNLRLKVIGWLIRFAVCPLIVAMLAAITARKMITSLRDGPWKMAREKLTDWPLLPSCLLIVGAGAWSLDSYQSQQAKLSEPS